MDRCCIDAALVPGSKWRDNDPRCPYRVVEVVHVYPNQRVRIRYAGRETTTKRERFGKAGRIGFTLVSSNDGAPK